MKTFVDNAGRTWTVAITTDEVKRIKDLLKVNLMEAVEGDLIERLDADPILLVDLLYCACKDQADAATVSDRDFGRGLAGDALEAATAAFREAVIDFFPKRRRELLRKATALMDVYRNRAMTAVEGRLDGPELRRRLDETLSGIIASSGGSAESSASTPAPSPSAS